MRYLIPIFFLSLIVSSEAVADTANECIACQNRCLKTDPSDYANCKLKCKGSSVCLGHKKPSKRR